MYLVKNRSGLFTPYDNSDYEESKKIPIGSTIKAMPARNYEFHKKMFALFKLAHENQDKIESFEAYRKILLIKAGYYHEVPTKNGEAYFIPKSLSYDQMNQEEFSACYQEVLNVVAKEFKVKPEQLQQELNSF